MKIFDHKLIKDFLSEICSNFTFDREDILLLDKNDESLYNIAFPDTHIHDFWELKLVFSRPLVANFPGEKIKVSKGQLLAIPPGVVHYQDVLHGKSKGFKYFNISFDKEITTVLAISGGRHNYFLIDSKSYSVWSEKLGDLPHKYLDQAFELDRENIYSDRLAASMLGAFFSSLALVVDNENEAKTAKRTLVDKVLRYIRCSYYYQDLSVNQIAGHFCVSPKYLAYVFKKNNLKTVRQTLIEIRLSRAKELLETGNHSVKEVSYLTGWQNQFYFSNSFKKHFGYYPSLLKKS